MCAYIHIICIHNYVSYVCMFSSPPLRLVHCVREYMYTYTKMCARVHAGESSFPIWPSCIISDTQFRILPNWLRRLEHGIHRPSGTTPSTKAASRPASRPAGLPASQPAAWPSGHPAAKPGGPYSTSTAVLAWLLGRKLCRNNGTNVLLSCRCKRYGYGLSWAPPPRTTVML